MQRVAHTDNADEPHPSVSQHSANSSTKRSIQQDSNYPASSPARPPGLPTFAQWQAKQLSSRDIIFAVFVLSMYLLYLRKTVPAVCSNAPMNSQQQGMGGHYRQQQWPTLWHVICGQPLGGALSGNWFTTAFMSLVKAVVTFTSVGVLSGDPLHIFMPPLRISLLLLVLVPLPYISMHGLWMNISKRTNPSSSSSSSCLRIIRWYDPDTYWRHPSLRNVVILLQRITPSAIAAGCLALNACGIGWYTLVQKTSLWRLVGKYSFQGWVAWLAVLPLRFHLVFNTIEWAINYVFYSNTLDADGKIAGYFELDRLIISFTCVVVLPTLGVVWLETSHKRRYQQMQQALGARPAAAAAIMAAEEDVIKGGKGGGSSTSSRDGASDGQQQQEQRGACTPAEQQRVGTPSSSSTDAHEHTAVGGSNSSSSLSHLLPALESLLGDQTAKSVTAAAAAAASAAGEAPPLGGVSAVQQLLGYESSTECLPVSIKVHTPHHQQQLSVSALGPVLTSALHYQLSPYNTAAAPLAISTACFEGCVQLIANVLGLKLKPPTGPNNSNSRNNSSSGHNPGGQGSLVGASSQTLAAALLERVVDSIRLVVNPLPGSAAAPSDSSSSQAAKLQVDVAVGSTNVSTRASGDPSSNPSSAVPCVTLRCCEPACLIADEDQEVELSLKLSGPQHQQQQPGCQYDCQLPRDVRLLVLRDGVVVLDEDHQMSKLISLKLPAQQPGALSLALLPGKKPSAAAAGQAQEAPLAAGASIPDDAPPAAPAAAAVPLLLLPLLVLPQAAAEEVCRYNDHMITAAAVADNSCGDSKNRAWQSVAALITDVAYVLCACAAASKAAAVTEAASDSSKGETKQQLPVGVHGVLKHLLVHLAGCGMFKVMEYVVGTAAAVFVAAQTGGDSCSNASAAAAAAAVLDSGVASVDSAAACACSSSNEAAADKQDAAAGTMEQCHSTAKLATSAQLNSSNSNSSSSSVTFSELLWGFSDPALEARYQAAAFSSSGWLDFFSFIYMAMFSVGFFLRQQSSPAQMDNVLQQQCALQPECSPAATPVAAASGPWGATFSDMLFTLAYLSGPLPVLLLRIKVARQLQRQQQQRDTAAVLVHAAGVKQGFMLFWMAATPLLTGLFAVTDVLVTPAWVIKAWGQRGVSQDLGSVFAICLKGFTGQVPYSCFCPIMAVQILLAALGSLKFGLRPRYGILVRYLPALALSMTVNARQQIQGRRRFCAGRGITVVQ